MKIEVFIVSFVLLLSLSKGKISPPTIWSRLGWKSVALLKANAYSNTYGSNPSKETFQFLKDCSRLSIKFVSLTLSQFWKMDPVQRHSLNVVIEDDFEIIPRLKEQGAYRFMVMSSKGHNLEHFVRFMRDLELDVGLLHLSWNNLNEAQLLRIHSFRYRIDPVMNLWTPMESLNLFHENYNMNGTLFHSVELEYLPSFGFVNCSIGDFYCQGQGKPWDTHMSVAQVMNFTLLSAWNEEKTWGNIASFTNHSSSDQSVLGKIRSNIYDGSINEWIIEPSRGTYFDHCLTGLPLQQIVIISPISKPLDLTFYLRTFSWKSLYVLAATVILLLVLLWYGFKITQRSNSIGLRILIISSWLFFVLVQAYYGGALTMFLTTDVPLVPFKSLFQGLQMFPEWQILVGPDTTFLIEQYAENPSLRGFNKYREGQKDAFILGSTKELLVQLNKGKYFSAGLSPYIAKQFEELKASSHPDLELQVVGLTNYRVSGLLQKYSPWKRVIDRGMLRIWDNGLMETIHKRWHKTLPFVKQSDHIEISLTHFGPVLLSYLGTLVACTFILIGELAYLKFQKRSELLKNPAD